MRVDDFIGRLEGVRRNGSGWVARCPAHEDRRQSLGVKVGDDERVLVNCYAGCSVEQVVGSLGLELKDLFEKTFAIKRDVIVDTYDYVDDDGSLLYQVVRYKPKNFRQRRPATVGELDENGELKPGQWEWKLGDVKRVLYRQAELREAVKAGRRILLVEGEKDVEAVIAAGGAATTNVGGAQNWKDEYTAEFVGAHVWVIVDNDEPGLKRGDTLAEILKPVAASVQIRKAAAGKDAYDHLKAGFGLADFVPVMEKADGLVLVSLNSVAPEAIDWVPGFEHFVPLGKIALLAGDGGVNKSTLSSTVAAQVTRELERAAVFVTTEDGGAGFARTRAEAAGADVNRCFVAELFVAGEEGHILLPENIPAIEQAINEVDAGLLVIDPVTAHLSVDVDSHKDASIRLALAPLAKLAQRQKCAVLIVAHLNKDKSTNPKTRVGGSGGLYNISRSAMLMAPHPDDEFLRVVASFKNQYGPRPESKVYRIEPTAVGDELVPRTTFFGTDWRTADSLLRFAKKEEA